MPSIRSLRSGLAEEHADDAQAFFLSGLHRLLHVFRESRQQMHLLLSDVELYILYTYRKMLAIAPGRATGVR